MNSVLIVEEDEVIRGLVKAIVTSAGYRAVDCCQAGEVLRIASESPIDAIILDCLSHNARGAETLKRLRADSRTASIPVIAMCGLGQFGAELGLWAKAVIIKPFRPAQLLMKLQYALRVQADPNPFPQTAVSPMARAV